MYYIEYFFLIFAIYRIKYPSHFYSEGCQYFRIMDNLIKVLILVQLAVEMQDLYTMKSILQIYSIILPHYPWFLLLSFLPNCIFSNTISIICIYGLEQSPWNKNILYKIEKYKIFVLALANVFSMQ